MVLPVLYIALFFGLPGARIAGIELQKLLDDNASTAFADGFRPEP